MRNAPAYDLDQLRRMFNIDSLLDVRGIQTLRHLDSLRGSVVQASQQWDSVLADFERSKDRAAKIETDIRAIEANKLNNPERITQAISTVQEAYNGINEIKQTVDTRKSVITGQISAQTDLGPSQLNRITRTWLGDFAWALPAVGSVGTWVQYGFCMVLFLAGMQRIPADYYEAAELDGASWWFGMSFISGTVTMAGGEKTSALPWGSRPSARR